MAIAFDAASSTSGMGNIAWPHTCTGSDLLLRVGFSLYGGTVQSATYNGVPLTLSIAKTEGSTRVELWYLIAPATGTHTIAVVLSSGQSVIVAGADSWTGVDQSTSLGTAVSASGSGTAATVDVASAAGEVVVDVLAAGSGSTTATVGAGQTERWNTNYTSTMRGAGSNEGGAATVTMSWTLGTSRTWTILAVPIKPGTGGGGGPTTTTATEVWPIPARTEPFPIADGYDGELARALSSMYPHLLAWKVVNGEFIWHDLGWLPAQAPIDAMAVADVPLGSGVDPGLTLFGVESHDSVVLTSLASSALGASQRRFPDPGGVAGTKSGVLYLSRMEFNAPNRLLAVRIWGEDFQQADTVRFAYRWDRRRWYSIGEIHGLPATAGIQDNEGGMFLEVVTGFTDKYAWEPSLPVITRIDVQVEPLPEAEARSEPDVQIPEQE